MQRTPSTSFPRTGASGYTGHQILRFCTEARATLRARLCKPLVSDEVAFSAYCKAIAQIRQMDYNELRQALIMSPN